MTGDEVSPEGAVVGQRYRVEFYDFCVDGVMTGVLVEWPKIDDGGAWSVSLDCGKVEACNVKLFEVDTRRRDQ